MVVVVAVRADGRHAGLAISHCSCVAWPRFRVWGAWATLWSALALPPTRVSIDQGPVLIVPLLSSTDTRECSRSRKAGSPRSPR